MSSLRNNVIANYIGTAWISLFSLILIPFYLKILGTEAYGLVGFFLAFRASLTILDFGLSGYSTREVARRSNFKNSEKSISSYIRTIELLYWFIGLLLCLSLSLFAFLFPSGWFKTDNLLPNVIQASQIIFAITLAFSWPISFYRGILRGLEKQVEYNYIAVFASTFRGVTSVLVLLFISSNVIAFFAVQMISSLIEMLLMRNMVWRFSLRKGSNDTSFAKFSLAELISAWRGIAAVSAVSILGILTAQADKLIISRQLPLEQLGYYTIAATIAISTSRLVDSIIVAIFPKFASGLIQNKHKKMIKLFELSSEFVILIYLPIIACSIFFSEQFFRAWTHSENTAIISGSVLAILICAQLLTKLSNISSNFQFAAGSMSHLIRINFMAFLTYLPILFFAIEKFGIRGAAISLLLINFIVCILMTPHIKKIFLVKDTVSRKTTNALKILLCTTLLCTTLKYINLPPSVNLLIIFLFLLIYYFFLAKKIWLILSVKIK